jgi:type IV pilus assembly protein PilM
MASSNVCWGIELGAGAIKALKLKRDGDGVKLVEFRTVPHKKVLSTPELDQSDATRVALGELVNLVDLTGAPIAISVPGHSGFARFAKLPPVEPKKIPDIVKFEAVQQIPFPIEQVEWDFQTFQTADSPDVEVGIFAVTRDKVMDRLTMWGDVGVTPDYVTLGPLAAYNAVAFDQNFGPKTPGTVILDVGTTSSDLIVCEPGRVWIRTFPLGGHQFTEALVSAFKLSYAKAEALKSQAEQSKHARHILQALRPVLGDLAQDVQRSIGFYMSGHKDANLTRLIGLGSTFSLPGLKKYLGQQLQMEVTRLDQFQRLTAEGPQAAEFEAQSANYATAYGLALQGLGFDHGIMANLMPVPVVRAALWKRKPKWMALAAGLSVAGGAVAFIRPLTDEGKAGTPPESIRQTAQKITQLKGEWQQVEGEFKPDFQAAMVAGLVQHRDVYAHMVDDLGTMLASAREKAASGDNADGSHAIEFKQFRTAYVVGSGPSSEGGGQDDGRGAPPPPADPALGADPNAKRRVVASVDVETTLPNAERFVNQNLIQWLRENAVRAGVPYYVDKDSVRLTIVERRTIESADAPRSGGREDGPGDGRGERQPPTDERGGGPGGGGPGDGGSGGAGGRGGASGAGDPNALAPIPEPKPLGKPGDTLFRLRINWDAIIGAPPAPPAEGST